MRFFITLIVSIIFSFGFKLNAQNKPNINILDDAVVLIHIIDHEGNKVGHGSGFIIDSLGTVITNFHVVEDAFSLKVITDINNFREIHDVDKILSGDKSKDLVTISIKNNIKRSFPFLKLSSKIPTKGEDVWAIGTPSEEDYMNTVSKGLVSNLNFSVSPKLIQTNAEITHGSSGGALINDRSEVVGITSSGDESKDGSRASINFAISILEFLNGLPQINKERLIDPNKIPCKLSFYTNNPYVGDVYLYVDAVYIGKFSKYFPLQDKPNCGDDGTLTRYLYSGNHTYTVYFRNTGQYYYGNIELVPGECKIFNVLNPSENIVAPKITYTLTDTPSYSQNLNTYSFSPFKKFDKKNYFDMAFYSGYSMDIFSIFKNSDYESGMLFPFSVFYEKSIRSNKFAIRSNYIFVNYKNNQGQVNYDGIKIDLKLIWNRKQRLNYFISPTFGLLSHKTKEDYYESYWDNQGQYTEIYHNNVINYSTLFLGGRLGLDRYSGKRFYFTIDAAFGTLFKSYIYDVNQYNGVGNSFKIYLDYNFIIGYRFHKINEKKDK
jgi:hypothetical protein